MRINLLTIAIIYRSQAVTAIRWFAYHLHNNRNKLWFIYKCIID